MAKVGRPSRMTPEVLDKLRQAYLIGATNAEACGYAEIGERTLYEYLEKNPEFAQRIEQWKNEPILKAKTTVVKNLSDVKNSQWYLERKAKDFKPKAEVDVTGFFDNNELKITIVDERDKAEPEAGDSPSSTD